MPFRLRYATRDELVDRVAEHGVDREDARAVLAALAELGVNIDALATIRVHEPAGEDQL